MSILTPERSAAMLGASGSGKRYGHTLSMGAAHSDASFRRHRVLGIERAVAHDAAGLSRLHDTDSIAVGPQQPRQAAGKKRFADAGVRAGDKDRLAHLVFRSP